MKIGFHRFFWASLPLAFAALILMAIALEADAEDSDAQRAEFLVGADRAGLTSSNGPGQDDLIVHTAAIRQIAYTTQLVAIAARYKSDLLEIIPLDMWKPVKEDGFQDYERIAESNGLYLVGHIPQSHIAAALNSVTVLPVYDGTKGRDREVYTYTRLLSFNYLEHAAKGHSGSIQAAVVACSHFIDFVLLVPPIDFPMLFATRTLDNIFEAVLAEELGYVATLSEEDVTAIRRLHESFRSEVESVRLAYGQDRPILTDSLIEVFRSDGLLK